VRTPDRVWSRRRPRAIRWLIDRAPPSASIDCQLPRARRLPNTCRSALETAERLSHRGFPEGSQEIVSASRLDGGEQSTPLDIRENAMSMTPRSAAETGPGSTGPTAATAVVDHWQVSQYVPIGRTGDGDLRTTGWRRADAGVGSHTTPASAGAATEPSPAADGGGVLTGGSERESRADRGRRPPSPEPDRVQRRLPDGPGEMRCRSAGDLRSAVRQ
jgi:hypothetical protein